MRSEDRQNQKFLVPEFNELKPRLKFPKNRFQLSAGLNLDKINTILSGLWNQPYLSPDSNSLNSASGMFNLDPTLVIFNEWYYFSMQVY